MLKFFTRLEKTRNFFILLFAILMVGSLVFWHSSRRASNVSANLSQSTETAATVARATRSRSARLSAAEGESEPVSARAQPAARERC